EKITEKITLSGSFTVDIDDDEEDVWEGKTIKVATNG
nr:hypothetical protein [Chlamydiota bacterium]